jgi:hypothetical protein
VLFGIGAVVVCFIVIARLAARHTGEHPDTIPDVAPPIPAFASGKAATAIELIEVTPDRGDSPQRPT